MHALLVLMAHFLFTSALPYWPRPPFTHPSPSSDNSSSGCLTEADAQQVATNFFIITGGAGTFNLTVAEATLADDFSDTSGSVASIVDAGGISPLPLLGPDFNKTSFINANAAQPATSFTQLNLYYTCNVVIQRFVANLSPEPALGISIFETVPAPAENLYPFQIKQVYGELDSAAWLVDLGIFQPSNASTKS